MNFKEYLQYLDLYVETYYYGTVEVIYTLKDLDGDPGDCAQLMYRTDGNTYHLPVDFENFEKFCTDAFES